MKPLDTFCENRKAKHERSKLFKHRAEIFELANRNYSAYAIAEFLATREVQTSRKNVDMFLKKHWKKNKQGATHTHNHQPALARAPQSPAKAGVNSKEKIGAEARAEAENEVVWDAVVNEDYRRNSEKIHSKYSTKD